MAGRIAALEQSNAALTAALAELRVTDALLLRRIQDAARARILLGERIEDIAESIPPRRLRIVVPAPNDVGPTTEIFTAPAGG